LDEKYSNKEERKNIKVLNISGKNLERKLNLENFTNLEKLNCSENLVTELDLISCNEENLIEINIDSNNFSKQDLSIFSHFTKLERLYLGTVKPDRVRQNLYNRFTGSLEYLKNLTKLKELGISNTDIDSGLEYLPKNLKKIYCVNYRGAEAGCEKIREELKKHYNKVLQYYDFQT
jgi:Leucine-rich repeat (LRR) protein